MEDRSGLQNHFVLMCMYIDPEIVVGLVDCVSYENKEVYRFEKFFSFEISYVTSKHILTKFELVHLVHIFAYDHTALSSGNIEESIFYNRGACIYSSNSTATYNPSVISLILIGCGDIETHPGPISLQKSATSKKPRCPECSRTGAKNHISLCCCECTV